MAGGGHGWQGGMHGLRGVHGRGHAWPGVCVWQGAMCNQEACVAGGVHGQGACMAGGCAWPGGMHGRWCAWPRGHAWLRDMHGRGAGGHAWQIL